MNKTNKKKIQPKNKTKNNSKTMVNKCMETFVEKNVKYWTEDYTKEIKNLEKKMILTKEDQKLLNKIKKQRKSQIKSMKKNYKLNNCNINCKNTILESGPANQLPKSMLKEFNYNKPLIKILSKRRKEIFRNKTNVLIDNFYDNLPEKTKKQLIKEGAISKCIA